MTVYQRPYCFRSIKVLSFMTRTLVVILVFGNKTWNSIVGEEMDGSCLGGPGDPLLPVFFSKKSGGKINSKTLKILVVIWSGCTPRFLPCQFLRFMVLPPPLNTDPIHHQFADPCGRIFDPSRNGSANYRDVKT
jgi:hypothetical protein